MDVTSICRNWTDMDGFNELDDFSLFLMTKFIYF